MTRRLKSKSATEVTHAMKDIIQTYGPPKHTCSDRGTEFTNAIYRTNILDKHNINMYHMDSAKMAVLAERAIRFIHMRSSVQREGNEVSSLPLHLERPELTRRYSQAFLVHQEFERFQASCDKTERCEE